MRMLNNQYLIIQKFDARLASKVFINSHAHVELRKKVLPEVLEHYFK